MNRILTGFSIVAVIGVITVGVFIYLEINGQTDIEKNRVEAIEETEEEGGESQEIVNAPIAKSVVTLANGGDGHSFIAQRHKFYNDSLGWGGISSTTHEEQKDVAAEIIKSLEGVKVKNEAIKKDLDEIIYNAIIVVEKDDRAAMLILHRLFHDLDIYFNGYSYSHTFGITEFTGE